VGRGYARRRRRRPYVVTPEDDNDDNDVNNDPDRQVGAVYDVTYEYNVTFRDRIVAGTEDGAKRQAKDQIEFGTAVGAHKVHTNVDTVAEIYESDDRADELK
jgi:hypothetical protein